MDRFTGKRVFITGAASGLGRALAMKFAGEGWKVAVSDINGERLTEAKRLLEKTGAKKQPTGNHGHKRGIYQ